MVDMELVRDTPLFAPFDEESFARVVSVGTSRRLERGDVLFAEGSASDHLYVVESGLIAISTRSEDSRETIFALMERGDLFGEMGLVDSLGRSAEARALESSTLIEIRYEPVRAVLEEHPELLWGVIGLLTRRLRYMDTALSDSMFLDVTGRTAKRLLELANGNDTFTLPVTQEELASIVGASRERVNKSLASFVRLGWIEQTDRNYVIVDRDQLTRRAR